MKKLAELWDDVVYWFVSDIPHAIMSSLLIICGVGLVVSGFWVISSYAACDGDVYIEQCKSGCAKHRLGASVVACSSCRCITPGDSTPQIDCRWIDNTYICGEK